MDLLTENLSQMSKQLTIIQDYITLKFGVDFQEFYKSRSAEEQELRETLEHQDNQLIIVSSRSRNSNSSKETEGNSSRTRSQRNQKSSINSEQEVEIQPIHIKTEDDFFEEMVGFSSEEDYGTDDDESYPKTRGRKKKKKSQIIKSAKEKGAASQNDLEQTEGIKKRKRLDYEESNSYEDLSIAKKSIKEENEFVFKEERLSQEGRKHFYYCKVARSCAAKIYLLINEYKPEVTCYRTCADHDHVNKEREHGIPLFAKSKINQLMDTGVKKPRDILRHLKSLPNFPIPTKRQIINYVKYKKTTALAKNTQVGQETSNSLYTDRHPDPVLENI